MVTSCHNAYMYVSLITNVLCIVQGQPALFHVFLQSNDGVQVRFNNPNKTADKFQEMTTILPRKACYDLQSLLELLNSFKLHSGAVWNFSQQLRL